MQLSDMIALAAMMRPPPGPQLPTIEKSPNNVTGLPMGRAALNQPPMSDTAQMLAAMMAAAGAPAEIGLRQAQADEAKRRAGILGQFDVNSIFSPPGGGGNVNASAPMPMAPVAAIAPRNATPPSVLPSVDVTEQYRPLIASVAARYGIPEGIFARQLWHESGFDPNAKSPAGALGIAQFMPGTAERFGIDPLVPDQAIPAAGEYLSQNREMFRGNLGLALAGYNWGEGNVQRWLASGADIGRVPKETRDYVEKITATPLQTWVNDYLSRQSSGSLPVEQPASSGLPPLASPPGTAAVNIDPLALARARVQLGLGGITGDPLAGFAQSYSQSPHYLGAAEAAKALGRTQVELSALPLQERIRADEAARLDAMRQRNALLYEPLITGAKTRAEAEERLKAAGVAPGSQLAHDILQRGFPDTRPPEIAKFEYGVSNPQYAQREMDLRQAGRPQTTINNVTSPILAGVAKRFDEDAGRASAAERSIEAMHTALDMVNSGMISGPGANERAFLQRAGELFGLPAQGAANMAAFQSAMGDTVLSLVKELGSGVSISNADREFAAKMAGGTADLGEASIRRIIEIREKLSRQAIDKYNQKVERLLKENPDDTTLQQVAPLMRVPAPPTYDPAQRQGMGRPGAAMASPTSKEEYDKLAPGTQYRAPDGSIRTKP